MAGMLAVYAEFEREILRERPVPGSPRLERGVDTTVDGSRRR
jgi:hypothetical protein